MGLFGCRLVAFSKTGVCSVDIMYADFIFNNDILNGLHGKCYKSEVKYWLRDYRKSGKTLTLITKGELVIYISIVKKALQDYVNGGRVTSPSLDFLDSINVG